MQIFKNKYIFSIKMNKLKTYMLVEDLTNETKLKQQIKKQVLQNKNLYLSVKTLISAVKT